MSTQAGQSVFPLKTALAVATVAVALTTWHWRAGGSAGLEVRSLGAVAELPWAHHAARSLPVATAVPVTNAHSAVQAPRPAHALLIDDGGSLDRFYAALARLDAHGAHAGATVVHFGDSPTTADLITGDVRQELQQRFGDAGPGFNLIAKPWAWYQHRDIDETDSGWKFTTAVGLMREGSFGVGGVGFDGGKDAAVRYKFSGVSPDALELIWKSQASGGTVAILADDAEVATVDTGASAVPATDGATGVPAIAAAPQFRRVTIPAGTRAVSLRVTQGTVHLYGVLFERSRPGLTYDSIGLNGASITVLSRAIAKDMMRQSFAHLRPDLIIINYGTNEASFPSFIDKQYEGELRTAIARVREAAPNAAIMLMSPMDRGERGGGNAIATMATIPEIVAMQERVAADTGCAFFNTFQAMGGDGTMQRWYEGRPRLVGGDLIHPTPQGAKIVATVFVEQMELGYGRYQSRNGMRVTASPAAVVQKPSANSENRTR